MDTVIEVTIDNQGRIVIPSKIKSRLGLVPGMTLVAEKGDKNEVRLRINKEDAKLIDKDGILVVCSKPISDIENITRHERDQRVIDLSQRAGR